VELVYFEAQIFSSCELVCDVELLAEFVQILQLEQLFDAFTDVIDGEGVGPAGIPPSEQSLAEAVFAVGVAGRNSEPEGVPVYADPLGAVDLVIDPRGHGGVHLRGDDGLSERTVDDRFVVEQH